MKLFSKNSIIFYSLMGLVSLFVARFIRSLIDYSIAIEIIICSIIILPMYYLARKALVKYLLK
ncbi:MAG: hypothetical protein CMC84_00085 [Flavobacteriaceae bacterium]|jgi:hypothetical protein|nr:hypothetical protein [Flavobacteriaceae bacterium]|tara:strand:- start:11027 stop:11215 length:189 start_codon:yes stop_codon:yes gene_type:complete